MPSKSKAEIVALQLKRYNNIYQRLDQDFIKTQMVDSARSIDEESDMQPNYSPDYEAFLQPLIQQQLSHYRSHLLATLQEKEAKDLGTFAEFEQEQLEQRVKQKFIFNFEAIEQLKTEPQTDGQIAYCKMNVLTRPDQKIQMNYVVNYTSSDHTRFLLPTAFELNGHEINSGDVAYVLISLWMAS